MAMKKTFGGDSPLWQVAGKSFWTLSIYGSMAMADRDVFWKTDWVHRFFLSGGLYRRRGDVRLEPGALTWGLHGQGPGRATTTCGALVAPLHFFFGTLEASR
jgi:hypothetical protein